MAEVCKCSSGTVNSGIPNCTDTLGRVVKEYFVDRVAADGTINAIPCGTTIDQDFLTQKLNEPDPTKRWFPTGELSNVVDTRATPVTESIDGIDFNVEDGPRTFVGDFVKQKATANPKYLKFLKSLGCGSIMKFDIDENGTIIGENLVIADTTYLNGIRIQEGTLYALAIPKTATTKAKNQIGYTIDSLVRDEEIAYITSEFTDADLLGANGLLDVELAEGVIAGTFDGFSVLGTLVYGSNCNKLKFQGADDSADWELYNVTTDTAIVLTSVVENPEGTYTFVFPPQAAAQKVRATLVKEGFSRTEITIEFP